MSVALNRIVKAIENQGSGSAGASLPAISAADSGKPLVVSAQGAWSLGSIPTQLPTVSAADAGMFLGVNSSGQWAAMSLPSG